MVKKSLLRIFISVILSIVVLAIISYVYIYLFKSFQSSTNLFFAFLFLLHIPILFIYIIPFFFQKKYNLYSSDIGFSLEKAPFKIFFGGIIGSFVIIISMIIFLIFNNLNIIYHYPNFNSFYYIIVFSIIIGVWEECYFRGFLINLFEINGINSWLSIIISSLLFSIAHFLNFGGYEFSISWFMGLFILGIFLSLLYKKYNSIFVPIGFHILWNIISFCLIGKFGFRGIEINNFKKYSTNLDNIETIIVLIILFFVLITNKKLSISKKIKKK